MPNIADIILEYYRQASTGDTEFYKILPYVFKLITKPGHGPTGQYDGEALFPLPIAPTDYSYDMDFAVELSAQDRGLIAEEGGIIMGQIHMAGTMGFKLKSISDTSFIGGARSFTGMLPSEEGRGQKVSGQMHLWRLLGRCFDCYSELKKDPETAPYTRMELHVLKDRLHLAVVPRKVRIIRNPSPYRVTYGYEIEVTVVGEASELNAFELTAIGDDKSIWERIKGYVADARKYMRALQSTIDDIRACVGDFKRFVSNIGGILGDMSRVVSSVSDFVNGEMGFIQETKSGLLSLASDLETALGVVGPAVALGQLPRDVARSVADGLDALEGVITACRGSFKNDWDMKAMQHATKVQPNKRLTDEEKTTIQTTSEATGQTAQNVFSARFKPGDAQRLLVSDPIPAMLRGKYAGYKEVAVNRGDSLETLAIKYLGDPNAWRDIAAINNLRPPFLSGSTRLPNSKMIGDPIIIPLQRAVAPVPTMGQGNSGTGGSQIETLMGKDIRLELLSNGLWDWYCDDGHGAVDIQTIGGLPNLVQGLETRLRTDLGTNPQFPADGLPPMVGQKSTFQLYLEARFALEKQVLADPRINRVVSATFEVVNDAVTCNVVAQPVGYDTNRIVPLQIT